MQFVRLRLSAAAVVLAAAILATPVAAHAQGEAKVVTPSLDFSGLILANYQNKSDSISKAPLGGKDPNKFEVERVYLTFRMPAGDRASIRVTTDVLNNTDGTTNGFYKGWVVRLKYAYAQLNFANDIGGSKGFNALARVGVLHTVMIDHEEGFWPRYLGQTAEERFGFFSSADLGGALQVSLPGKMGEVYATITNGPGYSAAETDRFKDFAGRLTITPFANNDKSGWFKTTTISPWFYAGQTASKFAAPTAGQVGAVTDGLKRNRFGVFAGNKDKRLTLGVSYAERTETFEKGANTAADPRIAIDSTGRLIAGFAVVRPGAFMDDKGPMSRWGIIARIDNFTPATDRLRPAVGGVVPSGTPAQQFLTAGVFWDATSKITFSADVQNLTRKDGLTTPESKIFFIHMSAAF